MNTIKKIVIVSFLAFVSGQYSCTVLDQPYYMGDSPENIFSDPENVRATAVGMYDALQNPEYLGGRALIYTDVRSDITNTASYFGTVSSMIGLIANNTTVRDAWRGAYRTLAEANSFIEGITANTDVVSASEKDRFIAEAKFIRALVNFYLLNLWGDQYTANGTGLGIPIVERSFDGTSAFTDDAKIPRSTVAKSWEAILQDLTDAISGLPLNNSGYEDYYRANKYAAYALRSRVHLYMGNYPQAISDADFIINANYYDLDGNLATLWSGDPYSSGSDEAIFFIAHNLLDNPNTNHALYQHYAGRNDVTVRLEFAQSFEMGDTRIGQYISAQTGTVSCRKYKSRGDAAPIVRYAEVLLNKAEALAKSTNSVDATALGLLNEIRNRAGLGDKDATDFANASAFIDEILAERKRELCFEGHASFDNFRNGIGVPARGTTAAIPYPSNWNALPIPQNDIDYTNNVLVQNPGYGD